MSPKDKNKCSSLEAEAQFRDIEGFLYPKLALPFQALERFWLPPVSSLDEFINEADKNAAERWLSSLEDSLILMNQNKDCSDLSRDLLNHFGFEETEKDLAELLLDHNFEAFLKQLGTITDIAVKRKMYFFAFTFCKVSGDSNQDFELLTQAMKLALQAGPSSLASDYYLKHTQKCIERISPNPST